MKSSIKSKFFDASRPLVIGHRGTAGTAPENTVASFDQALRDGADILETDIHLTKDGEIVLCHNDTLEQTTNGSGLIENHTLAELKKLDAGYRFSQDGGKTFPFRGNGVTIPTLREVFDRYEGVRFNIDLKSKEPALVTKTLDMIKEKRRDGLTVLGSFNSATVKKIRKQAKKEGLDILTCATEREVVTSVIQAALHLPSFKKPFALEVPVKEYGINVVTKEFVKRAHANGHFVAPWTINDPEEMMKLLEMGVDGLITDYPERAAKVVKQFKGRNI